MRITILTVGTLGDVIPFVALGAGLKRAGHQVKIATNPNYQQLVSTHNLDFFPLSQGIDVEELLETSTDNPFVANKNWLSSVWKLSRLLQNQLSIKDLNDLWFACQSTEAIIYSTLTRPAYHVAQKLGVPCYAASVHPPMHRTREFPSPFAPQLPLGWGYNWSSHWVVEQAIWQTFRGAINQWRQETLELPPLPLTGPYQQQYEQHLPVLYGLSPVVFPQPRDWGSWMQMTGYWFLETPTDWQPPAPLVEFLAAGPAPICVGFGSTSVQDPLALTHLIVDALTRSQQRGIIVSGWSDIGSLTLPDSIFVVKSVPYRWLFPQVAAVIHQGGSGTTALSLEAGVPSLAIPFGLDQFVFARRLAEIGASPPPIPFARLTVDRLAAAIRSLTDRKYRTQAEHLGRQIRAEDGVTTAVSAFHQHLPASGTTNLGAIPSSTP